MKCEKCTLENAVGAVRCAACDSVLGVACPSCTFVNFEATCAMCGTDLGKRCGECTFSNPPRATSCALCGAWWCDACGACNPATAKSCVCADNLVYDFEPLKVDKTLRRSPGIAAKIAADPLAFFRAHCGVPPPPSSPERPRGRVVAHIAFEEEEDAPRKLVETYGRQDQGRWRCGMCDATNQTKHLLEAHMLVRHIRNK